MTQITQSSKNSVKLSLKLTESQIGPFPVSVESLWFDVEGQYFRVKNIPFFVDDLSYDDLVSLTLVDTDLYQVSKNIEPSGNSTVWLLVKEEDGGRQILDRIRALSCRIEGGVLPGYFAINVPQDVEFDAVLALIEPAVEKGLISADYPSIRK